MKHRKYRKYSNIMHICPKAHLVPHNLHQLTSLLIHENIYRLHIYTNRPRLIRVTVVWDPF